MAGTVYDVVKLALPFVWQVGRQSVRLAVNGEVKSPCLLHSETPTALAPTSRASTLLVTLSQIVVVAAALWLTLATCSETLVAEMLPLVVLAAAIWTAGYGAGCEIASVAGAMFASEATYSTAHPAYNHGINRSILRATGLH